MELICWDTVSSCRNRSSYCSSEGTQGEARSLDRQWSGGRNAAAKAPFQVLHLCPITESCHESSGVGTLYHSHLHVRNLKHREVMHIAQGPTAGK